MLGLAAEHRRLSDRGVDHAGQAHVDAEGRGPRTWSGRSRRHRLADQAELVGGLERRLGRRLERRSGRRAGHSARSDPWGQHDRPPAAWHSATGTPQRLAAASFSISRAAAPAWRSGCMNARTLVLPPCPACGTPGSGTLRPPAPSRCALSASRTQLLGEDHRQRGVHALTHLRLGEQKGDRAVGGDLTHALSRGRGTPRRSAAD